MGDGQNEQQEVEEWHPTKGIKQIPISQLAFALLKSASKTSKNIVISPTSISMAFALIYIGSTGESREQLEEVFGFDADLTLWYNQLSQLVEVANGIWIDKTIGLRFEYERQVVERFGATITEASFSQPAIVAEEINKWVFNKTHGHIDQIIDKNNLKAPIIFVNALAFDAKWQKEFVEGRSYQGNFTTAEHQFIKVLFMNGTYTTNYGSIDNTHILELPLKGGLSMLFLLPDDINKLIASLVEHPFTTFTSCLQLVDEIDVSLPKFDLIWEDGIVPMLKSIGLSAPFNTSEDYREIADTPLQVDNIIHKARLVIDEHGARGGAATAIIGVLGWSDLEFIADRPFVAVVTDTATKSQVIFAAKVSDPRGE